MILIDAIVLKIRDGKVANRPVYVAMGINLDGERDILGMWVGPSGGEGAKFWHSVLTELANRGIADALVVCCDGLKGLPDAIRATWPMADVQLCVVHLVRNSLRYASKRHWGQITKQLKLMYTAPTVEAAEAEFEVFADTWREKYPAMIRSWETAWPEFIPFLDFPADLRKIVYTTDVIVNQLPRVSANLYYIVRRIARASTATLPDDALVHGFRHHYGLQLALRGLPPATLQQLMGHSDPRTTAIYTRHASFDLINALDDAGWL